MRRNGDAAAEVAPLLFTAKFRACRPQLKKMGERRLVWETGAEP